MITMGIIALYQSGPFLFLDDPERPVSQSLSRSSSPWSVVSDYDILVEEVELDEALSVGTPPTPPLPTFWERFLTY